MRKKWEDKPLEELERVNSILFIDALYILPLTCELHIFHLALDSPEHSFPPFVGLKNETSTCNIFFKILLKFKYNLYV